MRAAALKLPAEAAAETVRHVTAFLRGFSVEASRLAAGDADALAAALPAQTRIYLTAVAGRSPFALIDPAARLRARGFEPVPHLAARELASHDALEELLSRLAGEAGVRRILVVAGDRDRPLGPFNSALEVIEGGLLQRHGIAEVGLAAYPEGHPRIPPDALDRALAAKIEAAEQTGLGLHIVSQFGFDAAAILTWLRRLRDLGIEHPVRIGMAGPADLATLLRYARRCGVRASALGLMRQAGLVKHLLGNSTPDGIIRPLAEACGDGRLGRIGAHFHSFGGAAATVRWASAAAAGRIVFDRADGFGVEPP
jgi:methylenetetrahydrofolate reductase (NADPH)